MNDIPSPAQFAEATVAAYENAARLLADAELLLAAGRHPTAHALAVIALEEIGKHVMFASANIRARADKSYARRYRKRLGDHADKSRNALLLAGLTARTPADIELIDHLDKAVESEQFAKLRGLYVDLANDGNLVGPNAISPEAAEQTVRRVRRLVEVTSSMSDRPMIQRTFALAAKGATQLNAKAEQDARDPVALALGAGKLARIADLAAEEPPRKRQRPRDEQADSRPPSPGPRGGADRNRGGDR